MFVPELICFIFVFVLSFTRLQREYSKINFEQLLAEKGINSDLLMPRQDKTDDPGAVPKISDVSPFLPLEVSPLLLSSLYFGVFGVMAHLYVLCLLLDI